MSGTESFNGFYTETIDFFKDLSNNNNKTWFDENRGTYDEFVVRPSRRFVEVMGKRLSEVAPNIIADPRVNKSLFRINRDVRFSKDKSPYKTNLAIWFCEGKRKRMECSGFYFHMEPEKLMLGGGIYKFDKPHMEEYRRSVVHPTYGKELFDAINRVEDKPTPGIKGSGSCGMYPGERYKRLPKGFDPEHENADLLLNKGLVAYDEGPIPEEFYSADIIDYAFDRYKWMLPLHQWLVKMVERI